MIASALPGIEVRAAGRVLQAVLLSTHFRPNSSLAGKFHRIAARFESFPSARNKR